MLTLSLLLLPLGCQFRGDGIATPDIALSDIRVTPDLDERDLAMVRAPDLALPDVTRGGCRDCPMGCDDQDRCQGFEVSNVVDSRLILQGSGDLVVSGELVLDTTTAQLRGANGVVPGVGFYSADGGRVVVLYASRLHIARGATLRVVGKRPLQVLLSDEALIEGTLDLSAKGRTPGAGGGAGGERGKDGEVGLGSVCAVAYAGDAEGTWDATGGAGGSFYGRGGDGGKGGPRGRNPCAPNTLVPLVGGSGGGGGARIGGSGGGGGGALQISAWRRISVAAGGVVSAGGGGGGGGDAVFTEAPGSGGGGGSGGGILLEAPTVGIAGIVAANGGGGGGGGHRYLVVDVDSGDPGQDGQASARAAAGGDGGGNAGDGGDGAAADKDDGTSGEGGTSRGGGGGGAAGAIYIGTKSGTSEGSGTKSPGATVLSLKAVAL